MFRSMRRKDKALDETQARSMLEHCTYGMLAVQGDDQYPYAVPMSFALKGDKIYFHCAKKGHKIDAMMNHSKVSFCVVEKDEIIPEAFNTLYRSAVVFGKAEIITDDTERLEALRCLVKKYSPDYISEGEKEISDGFAGVCVVAIKIEHMTGKAGA